MTLNKDVFSILEEFRIDRDQGVLCLLGIYFGLDIETTCKEEVIKAINLTKIVEKDYVSKTLNWNIPLFEGQETAFEWVKDWMESFGRTNPERRGSHRDAISRMKDFFKRYPEYRKEDVYKARDLYLSGLNSAQYCMHSHKFIFDGAGAMRKSTLLAYCERVNRAPTQSNQKGKIIT